MENSASQIVIIARHRHIDAQPTLAGQGAAEWPADVAQALEDGRISVRRAEQIMTHRARNVA